MSELVIKKGGDALAALKRQLQVQASRDLGESLVLALDMSPSMKEGNKMGAMRQAASDLITLSTQSEVSILSFSGRAYWHGTWDKPSALKTVADGLIGGWGTNLAAAVINSADALLSRTCQLRRVVLMTDGEDNSSDLDPVVLVEEYASKGLIFDTVAFGKNADRDLLRRIAAAGRGTFKEANNAVGLVRAFRQLEASKRGLLPPAGGTR